MSADRRQARILAMQALAQWDVQRDESAGGLQELFESMEAEPTPARYATALVIDYWRQRTEVDAMLGGTSAAWDFARMGVVERNTLRVAVTEVLSRRVPPKVAIDEAIEIAREFGGVDSPRFVNGVLDEALREIRGSEKESSSDELST